MREPRGKTRPNHAVEPTPNSFRSCVAPALGRGSPRALDCQSEGDPMRIIQSALSLNVNNIQASADFAVRHLGFVVEMSAEGVISLRSETAGFNLVFLQTGLESFRPATHAGTAGQGMLVVFIPLATGNPGLSRPGRKVARPRQRTKPVLHSPHAQLLCRCCQESPHLLGVARYCLGCICLFAQSVVPECPARVVRTAKED
jgi:hypothetical protein